jgi:hypothetical protein
MSCGIRSDLLAEVGSETATNPAALYLAFPSRWALTPPRVLRHRTRWEGSGAPLVSWLQILPPYGEGSGLLHVLRLQCGQAPLPVPARRVDMHRCQCLRVDMRLQCSVSAADHPS